MPRILAFCLLLCAAFAHARQVTVRVLATTDLHGNLYPYDYYTAQPAARGLAKIATLIATERGANPNNLLVDCGDTIQGTPMEAVYQYSVVSGRLPLGLKPVGTMPTVDPMMLAMNALHYDAMAVGNHEWNFGLKVLNQAREAAQFPWISANIGVEPNAPVKPFAPYIVKTVAGVRIAVIGATTPGEPVWEKPENYAGYRFLPIKEAVAAAVADLKRTEHPDVILVAAHSGLDRNLKTGVVYKGDLRGENAAYEIASEVPGVDAIFFGHTHSELADGRVGDVLLVQPRNWGMSLGEMDLTLEDGPDEHWRIVAKTGRVIPVTAQMPADEALLRLGKPYHEDAERFLETPVAQSLVAMDGALGRVEDTPLVDMIQTVQLHYAHADVSFASLFNPRISVPKGPVSVRQIAALYLYPNTLYAIEGDGKMVREALENAARYFLTCAGDCSSGPLIARSVIGYNADMAAGVEYEVNLRQPEGHRIENLRWHGAPLADAQKLRIALNNYRAGGGAGYTMFRGANVVWRSAGEIRDLIIEYYSERKTVPEKPNGNWRVVPAEALRELEREAQADARRAGMQ